MAGEHTLVWETHQAIPFTVTDVQGIEKGTLLTLSDPMTASATTTKEAIIAGVAKNEKIASDGNTKLAVYRGGIFKATASGTIGVGDSLISSVDATAGNKLETAGVNAEDIVGISFEAATDGQTFLYELKPNTLNLA